MNPATPVDIVRMTDLVADRSVREEGCLSPIIDVFAKELEATHEAAFKVAYDLNRVALAAWMEGPNEGADIDPGPITNRLMIRAINNYGGAVLLARRGMDAESQTLSRTIYECAFWLGLFAHDGASALNAFLVQNARSVAEHTIMLGQQGLASEAEIEKAQDTIKTLEKVKVPGMYRMAERANLLPLMPHYKVLCGMAAHSSLSSLNRYMDKRDDGMLGHQMDFAGERIPESLAFAITGLVCALQEWQKSSFVPIDEAKLDAALDATRAMFGEEQEPPQGFTRER